MNTQLLVLLVATLVAGTYANHLAYLKICPDMGVYNVPNPRSCSKFYICFNGQVIQRSCATGLNYDTESGTCKVPHLTECKLEFCKNANPLAVSMVADPDNCGQYYACSAGVSTPMRCPAGLLFNRAIASCDFPDNVKCVIESETFEPVVSKIQCPKTGVVKLANTEDCGQYSICVDGRRMDYYCSSELRYDSRSGKCIEPSKARCAK